MSLKLLLAFLAIFILQCSGMSMKRITRYEFSKVSGSKIVIPELPEIEPQTYVVLSIYVTSDKEVKFVPKFTANKELQFASIIAPVTFSTKYTEEKGFSFGYMSTLVLLNGKEPITSISGFICEEEVRFGFIFVSTGYEVTSVSSVSTSFTEATYEAPKNEVRESECAYKAGIQLLYTTVFNLSPTKTLVDEKTYTLLDELSMGVSVFRIADPKQLDFTSHYESEKIYSPIWATMMLSLTPCDAKQYEPPPETPAGQPTPVVSVDGDLQFIEQAVAANVVVSGTATFYGTNNILPGANITANITTVSSAVLNFHQNAQQPIVVQNSLNFATGSTLNLVITERVVGTRNVTMKIAKYGSLLGLFILTASVEDSKETHTLGNAAQQGAASSGCTVSTPAADTNTLNALVAVVTVTCPENRNVNSPNSQSSDTLSTGAIVGIVVGSVALLAIITIAAVYIIYKKKKKEQSLKVYQGAMDRHNSHSGLTEESATNL